MSTRERERWARSSNKETERHPNVRFSMVRLDVNENGLPLNETPKTASASRRLLLIAVLCVIAAVILAIIAIAVGLALTGEARRAIGGQDGNKQLSSTTTLSSSSSSSSQQSYIPVSSTPVISHTTSPTTVGNSIAYTQLPTSDLPSATVVFSTTQLSPLTSSSSLVPTTVLLSSASVPPATPSLPACESSEFRCASGQCVIGPAVCDRAITCLDQSDEVFCPDCQTSGGFQCASGLCLWENRRRCNGVFDCDDLSDELNCPLRSNYYLCKNGIQIPQSYKCNGVDDCDDNSDENNCRCFNGRMPCPDGRCIMREWRCDGYADCINGTDEDGCNSCLATEFICRNHQCLNQSRVCDGKFDCYTGEDEGGCVHLESNGSLSVLTIETGNTRYSVCSDGWTDKQSHFICQHLDKAFKFTRFQDVHNTSSSAAFLLLQSGTELNRNQPINTFFLQRSDCPSSKIVALSCAMQECGARKASIITSFVAGGNIVPEGKWPWVVSLSYLGKARCAGALIDQQWVVTAGHCVVRPGQFNLTNTPSMIEILVGSVNRLANTSTTEKVRAVKIYHHPYLRQVDPVSEILDWDAALVKLARPVKRSDYIQPICLPYSGQSFSRTSQCYLAGWGQVNNVQYLFPRTLREAKMQVWAGRRCERNTAGREILVNTNSTLCAGYLTGIPTGCQGDSGGPLMCRDGPGGPWVLAGIMSSGSNQCGNAPSMHANRFTKIAGIQQWIQATLYGS